ncbi:sirohydrochlorin chelatase [Rhodococcus sp. 27YEA15]|uniref:sirohydrochlorin chelatase n=1 Tax=Rhodococcus sp. 27YEA15 TaxID=3156259 RepID=UPI003C7EB5CC
MRGDDDVLVLVAHGTRSARGVEMIAALARAVGARIGRTRVAFVDVLGPSPSEVLRATTGRAVVVPAFLASGYHVHIDVRREVADSGHRDVTVTPALGPDPVLAGVMMRRLWSAGWRDGDAIVLAAAGSSDIRALRDVQRAAALLAAASGTRVDIGYVATAEPTVVEAVESARNRSGRRVFVASYLLAHGLFHNRLHSAGADGVSDPLGLDPEIVDLLAQRWSAVSSPVAGSRYYREHDDDVCRPGRSGS